MVTLAVTRNNRNASTDFSVGCEGSAGTSDSVWELQLKPKPLTAITAVSFAS